MGGSRRRGVRMGKIDTHNLSSKIGEIYTHNLTDAKNHANRCQGDGPLSPPEKPIGGHEVDKTQRSLPTSDLYEAMMKTGAPDELSAMKMLKQSTKFIFDCGSIPVDLFKGGVDFADQLQSFGLLRLPYDECLFQIGPIDFSEKDDSSDIGFMLILAHQNEANIYGRTYFISSRLTRFYSVTGSTTFILPKNISRDDWHARMSSFAVRDKCPAQTPNILLQADEDALVSMKLFSGWLFSCLGCLNSDGIESEQTPEKRFINARREAAGRPPIFGYRLLRVDMSKMKMPGLTATGNQHASPRMHWRRGHIRTLCTGKHVIVRPCLVGDYSNGQLDKEYVFSGPRQARQPALAQ